MDMHLEITGKTGYERKLGEYVGNEDGPTVIAIGGMHGNEPAGVLAIRHVLNTLETRKIPLNGRFFAFTGNLKALRLGVRYLDRDLNRCWTNDLVETKPDIAEYEEIHSIRTELEDILATSNGPVSFLDLHSFSGDGPPFVISDDLDFFNEVFTGLPFPIITELTSKIEGTLNHYYQALGHRAIAIEGGQHNDPQTVPNLILFLWLFLLKRNYIQPQYAPDGIEDAWNQLIQLTGHLPSKVRVNYRHAIQDGDMFKMFPGFKSFTPIRKGDPLGTDRQGIVYAPNSGCILMPLYQGQGNDGFFLGAGIA